jgi:hypothetical protein
LPAGPTRIASHDRRGAGGTGGSAHRASAGTTVVTTDLEDTTVVDAPPPSAIDVPVADPPSRAPDDRAERQPDAPSMSLADTLRSMVGNRHAKAVTDVDLVLNALEALGTVLDDDLAGVTTGAEMLALADERGAIGDGETVLLGDLIVLHDSSTDDPVIAIVVGIDDRGTIEIIHLSRRVVRRSFLTIDIPKKKRDADGVVLNTLIRHKEGNVPRGTKYLAGQLYTGHIRLDELVER